MAKEILKFIFLFIILTLCQVVVFNHICLFGVAVPLVFIYFIIKLPVTLGVNWAMTVSFLLGLTVDLFSNTQGMNALACTILSVCQVPVLNLYLPRQDDLGNPEPSIRTLGAAVFMKYAVTMTLIYCTLFFLIEAFAFFNVIDLILKIAGSSALTFVIVMAIDGLTASR
ncbi:MAG: rod shape-determining protein MreD, partial [Muribaculaceae bacterium]|nr:rod shape-determining protein MreD [Muribaculaceae bacterium]